MLIRTDRKVIAVTKTGMMTQPWLWTCSDLFSSSDDEEDETAELLRELEKIKRERSEQKEKEVCSRCRSYGMLSMQLKKATLGAGKSCRRANKERERYRPRQSSAHAYERR